MFYFYIQPWRLTCSGTESSITLGLELLCVAAEEEDEYMEEGSKRPTLERQDEREDFAGVDDYEDVDVRDQQKAPSSSRKNLGHLGDSGSSQEEPAPPQTSRKRKSLRNLFKKSTPLFNKSQSD